MQDELEPTSPGIDQPAVGAAPTSEPVEGNDREGAMAKADLYKLASYSHKLFKQIHDDDQLEAWVQAKITKAADYIASVYHYLEYEMKFSEYGHALDNSDVLSESQKQHIRTMLAEAKSKIKELKVTQAEKRKGKVEEGVMAGGEQPCAECGGTGVVFKPGVQPSEKAKRLAHKHNVATKAYAAAAKRIDANKNGIPDDEEVEEGFPTVADARKEKEQSQGTGKFDKKEIKPGVTQYTRKSSTFTDGGDDSDVKKAKKKKSKEQDVEETSNANSSNFGQGVYEGKSKKAKKDYDKDGKIESEKDEVIGSRRKAAGLDEGWDDMVKSAKDSTKEKGTGKFDKKEIKPGVTQYTRKSSTFTDGGDDADVKKAKKKVKETAAKMWTDMKNEAKDTLTKEGSIRGGVWTATPPDKGQKDVPPPSPDEGPTQNVKPATKKPVKKAEAETDTAVVAESADFARMQEQLARLNRSESHQLNEGSEADQIRELTKKLLG